MSKLLRRKPSNTVFFRNRGGFLAFLDQCDHPRKFTENEISFIDITICNIGCKKRPTCRDYWSRKARINKSLELNNCYINPIKICEELNG